MIPPLTQLFIPYFNLILRTVSDDRRRYEKTVEFFERMCNARQTNLANTLHVGGSSRAQRPNTPPGQHVCKRVFAHACIFCAAHLPGGAEISARVTRQKVLFFVRKDASEKALLKKKRKERVLKAQMNISRRVLSSPDDYGTREAFS